MAHGMSESTDWSMGVTVMRHRHEASYRFPMSMANGIERGMCACGMRVTRPIPVGVTPAENKAAWAVMGKGV